MTTRAICCLLFAASIALAARIEIGGRDELPHGWSIDHNQRTQLHNVEFTVFVKHQNLYKLEEKFWAVSNPDHAEYGQFLTEEEAKSLIAPKTEDMDAVAAWLDKYNAKVSRFYDHFTVRAQSRVAAKILGTDFKMHRDRAGHALLRAVGKISVPEEVHEHIHFIAGATELVTSTTSGKISAKRAQASPITVTPNVLKSFYNVPLDAKSKSPRTVNGIAAFNDDFNRDGFASFRGNYSLADFNVRVFEPKNGSPADYVESDLDVQYISAMAEGTDLVFIQQPNGYWILQFLVDAQKVVTGKKPTVYSISYGWFEIHQCMWATTNCPKLGYTGEKYVNRTDTMFQLFGATGVSVFVADGDDGAPGYNCPIDGDVAFCPNGNCYYGKSECPQLTITGLGQTCNFPALGQRENQPGCDALQVLPAFSTVLRLLRQANPSCGLTFQGPVGSSCKCEDIVPASINGVTAKGFVLNRTLDHVFAPIWPGSSPYVTSVGATFFNSSDGKTVSEEIVSSSLTGAVFTTGGGFSYFQAQGDYQTEAVKQWVKKAGDRAPPAWAYKPQYRGFPDIVFNGNNYDVYFSSAGHGAVGGTSASSPASAGLFNLVNDALLAKGKTPLGFLNPLLYKMAKAQPSTFNDITTGDNKCDGNLCCKYGYVATEGWDPVSGLGSPNYGEILKFVLKLKGL